MWFKFVTVVNILDNTLSFTLWWDQSESTEADDNMGPLSKYEVPKNLSNSRFEHPTSQMAMLYLLPNNG